MKVACRSWQWAECFLQKITNGLSSQNRCGLISHVRHANCVTIASVVKATSHVCFTGTVRTRYQHLLGNDGKARLWETQNSECPGYSRLQAVRPVRASTTISMQNFVLKVHRHWRSWPWVKPSFKKKIMSIAGFWTAKPNEHISVIKLTVESVCLIIFLNRALP